MSPSLSSAAALSTTTAAAPRVQGWCPGARRPMASGDGLVMRIRPRRNRLSLAQLQALASAAQQQGAGVLDFTSRANVQLRGLSQQGWAQLCTEFETLALLDADAEQEARRNILLNPDWQPGDDSCVIADELEARLGELPTLPAKFGFAIDAGAAPCLQQVSADLRIERSTDGALMLRLDGREGGFAVTRETAVDALIALAHWFVDSGGRERGRVARHEAVLPRWAQADRLPAAAAAPLANGRHELGWVSVLSCGQLEAEQLLALLASAQCVGVRLTPWRQLIFEDLQQAPELGEAAALAAAAASHGWRIEACAGAPQCVQALAATRPLAQRLLRAAAADRLQLPVAAGETPLRLAGLRVLHVSGCAKGCAHAAAAAVCVTATSAVTDAMAVPFRLSFNARAGDSDAAAHPENLAEADVLSRLGVVDAASV